VDDGEGLDSVVDGDGKQRQQKRALCGSVKPVAVLTTSLPYRLTIGLMLALVMKSKKI
jgi:hypothetical protein